MSIILLDIRNHDIADHADLVGMGAVVGEFEHRCEPRICGITDVDDAGPVRRLHMTNICVSTLHHDLSAALQTAEENLVGQRLFDLRLDQSRHRPRAKQSVEALFREPSASGLGQFERDVLVGQLFAQFVDEFFYNAVDAFGAQRLERDPAVETVAEFGAEGAFDGALRFAARAADAARFVLFEAEFLAAQFARAGVGPHA